MNDKITPLVLGAAIVLQVVLELKGIKVPAIVYLLSGFAVRHIIGDNGNEAPQGNVTQTKTIILPPTEIKT
jgi:hypothetical protein